MGSLAIFWQSVFVMGQKVALSAESQVRAWFEHQVPFQSHWVPRLLFVFEMLVEGYKLRSAHRAGAKTYVDI